MSEYKGLGIQLTEEELKVLSVFKQEPEIACPVGVGMSLEETLKILRGLTKKDIVTGRAPYRLTKLGKRLVADLYT